MVSLFLYHYFDALLGTARISAARERRVWDCREQSRIALVVMNSRLCSCLRGRDARQPEKHRGVSQLKSGTGWKKAEGPERVIQCGAALECAFSTAKPL